MSDTSEVELARHEVQIEQLYADLRRLNEELERERDERKQDKKTIEEILRMAFVARVIFIGAIAIGGFGSWLMGITDGIRRLFATHTGL